MADTPILHVASAQGSEDTRIPLAIEAGLTDTSEILSITIDGVPAGAALSAGAHNADGTWTLTPEQLAGLTVLPPANSDEDSR